MPRPILLLQATIFGNILYPLPVWHTNVGSTMVCMRVVVNNILKMGRMHAVSGCLGPTSTVKTVTGVCVNFHEGVLGEGTVVILLGFITTYLYFVFDVVV